jgi:hypothetical protein
MVKPARPPVPSRPPYLYWTRPGPPFARCLNARSGRGRVPSRRFPIHGPRSQGFRPPLEATEGPGMAARDRHGVACADRTRRRRYGGRNSPNGLDFGNQDPGRGLRPALARIAGKTGANSIVCKICGELASVGSAPTTTARGEVLDTIPRPGERGWGGGRPGGTVRGARGRPLGSNRDTTHVQRESPRGMAFRTIPLDRGRSDGTPGMLA